MGKVMRHTLGASLNIRHNLSSSKGPKPLQLKLLTTYIPKTSAFTLAFSTSQRLRTTRASARTQLTKLGYDATPFNQILKQNAKREMRLRLGKVTVADVLAAQPVTTNLLKFMRASIKMIGVSNLQSFIASMTQKLTLSD